MCHPSNACFLEPTRVYNAERHLDRFSRFSKGHNRQSLYFSLGRHFFLKIAPSYRGSGPNLLLGSLGSPESTTQTVSRSVQQFCMAHDRDGDRLKFSRSIFCNFHLEPKLWRHLWRHFRFCKSCRRAMRFSPLDSSEDFMARGGLHFCLSYSFRVMTSSMTS